MKKAIIVIVVLLLIGGGVGAFLYYDKVLQYTDDFTSCPVLAFRAAATSADGAVGFLTEANMVDLSSTERCSLDCKHGNGMACTLYGLAQQKGIFMLVDAEGSSETLQHACDKGETLACELETRAKDLAAAARKAEATEAAKAKYAQVLADLQRRKGEVGQVIAEALQYFGGNKGPMTTSSMLGWYSGTVRYLLFEAPLLSQMHQLPGSKIEKSGLKDFVLAKYMGGAQRPDVEKIQEFFAKFMRLGVQQIKLDYRVEKKSEGALPKRHQFFKAKHTFLYNAGQVELEILELLEKDINYEIENG